jgi:hypothetical protein
LAQVVSSSILDGENPVLIIVHMYKRVSGQAIVDRQADGIDRDWDQATVQRQASVIEAARSKNLNIYVVQKVAPDPQERSGDDISDTLPDSLRNAVKGYTHLHYFAERDLGNALEGRPYKKQDSKASPEQEVPKLRDILTINGQVCTAIVLGQSYGQCVDSTILGMYHVAYKKEGKETSYLPGLLDIGIDVVTARDVLIPPPKKSDIDSDYFCFEMEPPISMSPSARPAAKPDGPTRPTALTAPTEFAHQAATEKAATKAATQA